MAIQNYFVQVTVQKGKILETEGGQTEKIIDSTEMDDLFCSQSEQNSDAFIALITEEAQKLA